MLNGEMVYAMSRPISLRGIYSSGWKALKESVISHCDTSQAIGEIDNSRATGRNRISGVGGTNSTPGPLPLFPYPCLHQLILNTLSIPSAVVLGDNNNVEISSYKAGKTGF